MCELKFIKTYETKAYFHYCSSSVHYCEDHFHIHFFIRSSQIWSSYIHNNFKLTALQWRPFLPSPFTFFIQKCEMVLNSKVSSFVKVLYNICIKRKYKNLLNYLQVKFILDTNYGRSFITNRSINCHKQFYFLLDRWIGQKAWVWLSFSHLPSNFTRQFLW